MATEQQQTISMIGKTVEFQVTNKINEEGVVLDKITNSSNETCYIIQTEQGKLFNSIQHWRINKILK